MESTWNDLLAPIPTPWNQWYQMISTVYPVSLDLMKNDAGLLSPSFGTSFSVLFQSWKLLVKQETTFGSCTLNVNGNCIIYHHVQVRNQKRWEELVQRKLPSHSNLCARPNWLGVYEKKATLGCLDMFWRPDTASGVSGLCNLYCLLNFAAQFCFGWQAEDIYQQLGKLKNGFITGVLASFWNRFLFHFKQKGWWWMRSAEIWRKCAAAQHLLRHLDLWQRVLNAFAPAWTEVKTQRLSGRRWTRSHTTGQLTPGLRNRIGGRPRFE